MTLFYDLCRLLGPGVSWTSHIPEYHQASWRDCHLTFRNYSSGFISHHARGLAFRDWADVWWTKEQGKGLLIWLISYMSLMLLHFSVMFKGWYCSPPHTVRHTLILREREREVVKLMQPLPYWWRKLVELVSVVKCTQRDRERKKSKICLFGNKTCIF